MSEAKPTALLPERVLICKNNPEVLHLSEFTANICCGGETYARAHSPAQAEWLPIESAPKYPEGATPMLVYGAKRLEWAVAHRDVDDSWLVETCSDRINIYPPTHWMPLPQPPKESSND